MRAVAVVALAGCGQVFGLHHEDPPIDAPADLSGWIAVATGYAHSCGIRADHSLWCWGDNTYGELGTAFGDGNVEVLAPVRVDGAWRSVVAGLFHTCAIRDDATLWCWGRNETGQLGDGTTTARITPVAIGTDHFAAVAAGEEHTCAIRDDARLSCWGLDSSGQLGLDTSPPLSAVPMPVSGDHAWLAVTAGDTHTCALGLDHHVACWGVVGSPQLGDANVLATTTWTAIAAGDAHTCGLTDGHVLCWGVNDYGQLGDGTFVAHAAPLPVAGDRADITAIAAGRNTTCAIASDGSASCWGDNVHGELANDVAPIENAPQPIVEPATAWAAISSAGFHTCAIDASARMWCAGEAGFGALGDGGGGSRRVPTQIPGMWTLARAGKLASCAMQMASKQLFCWGDNDRGQLGDSTRVARQLPVGTPLYNATYLALGEVHVSAIATAGELYAWGDNTLGQLDVPATLGSRTAPAVDTNFTAPLLGVAASNHVCVIGSDRALYCFGANDAGQLGQGFTGLPSGPKYVSSQATYWTSVSANVTNTCAIRGDSTGASTGVLECWGDNAHGQLGIASTTTDHLPHVVNGSWKQVGVGLYHACGLTTSGAIACWGANGGGQLGDGTRVDRPAPSGPIDATTWSSLAVGGSFACAIAVDGSLWCWGTDERGELADGGHEDHLVPTRVGTDRDWEAVSAGSQHACATRTDHTLWCWGLNVTGQIGDGLAWRSRLVAVP